MKEKSPSKFTLLLDTLIYWENMKYDIPDSVCKSKATLKQYKRNVKKSIAVKKSFIVIIGFVLTAYLASCSLQDMYFEDSVFIVLFIGCSFSIHCLNGAIFAQKMQLEDIDERLEILSKDK